MRRAAADPALSAESPIGAPYEAQGRASVSLTGVRSRSRLRLTWFGEGAARFQLSVSVDGRRPQVLLDSTSRTKTTTPLRRGHRYRFTLRALDIDAASSFSIRG